MHVGYWFVAGLWAVGLVSGVVVATVRGVQDLSFPSLLWTLAPAFVVDLILMPFARSGRIRSLTMNERAIGVIGGALLHALVLVAFAES
jgi:hypothetical protein